MEKGLDAVVVGRIDHLDGEGHRLILGGMVFTLAKDVSLAGLAEGAVVKIRYLETRDWRIANRVERIGVRPSPSLGHRRES
jgi:hypothetical protein